MKIKLLLTGLLSLLLLIQVNAQNLAGSWIWNSDDGQEIFTISLVHESKDRVLGVHCIENFAAEFVECYEPGEDYTVSVVKIAENIFQGSLISLRGTDLYTRDVQLQYLPIDNTVMFTFTGSSVTPLRIPEKAVMRRI